MGYLHAESLSVQSPLDAVIAKPRGLPPRAVPPAWDCRVYSHDMDDLAAIGNQIEAALWVAFSTGFVVRAWRTAGPHRRLAGVLALAFLAFGISDLIEARTGAWWRPVWLLILKTACVGVFAYGLWEHLRMRRRRRESSVEAD